MADKKISDLTLLTGANLANDDSFVVVDNNATTTKRMVATELAAGVAAKLKKAHIADMGVVFTTNDPSLTADGSVTFADGSAPTDAELVEAIVELSTKVNTILARLESAGLLATS